MGRSITGIDRRTLLLSGAALLAPVAVHAQQSNGSGVAEVPLGRALPNVSLYLALPPERRSRWRIRSFLNLEGLSVADARFEIVLPGGKAALPLKQDAAGEVLETPSLDVIRSANLRLRMPPNGRIRGVQQYVSTQAMAERIEAAPLREGLAQADAFFAEINKATGTADRVPFRAIVIFPKGLEGWAISSNGAETLLPMVRGNARYAPTKMPDVVALRFPRPPEAIAFENPDEV